MTLDVTKCNSFLRASVYRLANVNLRRRLFAIVSALSVLSACAIFGTSSAIAQVTGGGSITAKPQISQKIDEGSLVTLKGHVLRGLTPDKDMGQVEDSLPVRLYMVLQRTSDQQADLETLLARQQQSGAAEYHQWLTPEQFGERFGAAATDINQIRQWLQSHGFEVTSVAKNATVINLAATAAEVRNTFHAELHYWNVHGGKYAATATEPSIPAALSQVVAGIAGLSQIPPRAHHTLIHSERYDAGTHKWYPVSSGGTEPASSQPHYLASNGNYNMTPQDFYTIYNVNPTFKAGNVGAGATIAILGSGPFGYGTVTNGKAAGGDVTTFRTLFGITTPLNLEIQSGSANFPCTVASGDDSGESALDVEWAGATAPGATLIFESCSGSSDGTGFDFLTETQALVDANVADIITSSIGFTEGSLAGVQAFETAFAQGAAQGQTFLSAQGDSGSDDADFGLAQGTHGLNVDYPGSSTLVLSVGGTDFQDLYDVDAGSSTPQSTYWSSTNTKFYGDALSYVPETAWNSSCASPLVAATPEFGGSPGETTATFCESTNFTGQTFGGGGGGGISGLFSQPSWQTGIPGLSTSITNRVTPDVSLFASNGQYWGHSLVVCDSGGGQPCSAGNFGFSGGTSFAAPSFAGILGLLKTSTGSRQGLVQPALYALAKAQYTAGTACYANGQTANTGVSKGLPASTCVFHDVTTNGNGNECAAGTPDCFSNPSASYGVLTSSGDTSTFVDAYAAGAKYDIATGLGSVNVTNLINNWKTAFTSSTSLAAAPTSITSSQSTTLTATVKGGTPAGYDNGAPPPISGTVTFSSGGKTLATCTISSTTCSSSVSGASLVSGANSITATFTGSASYPASTSSIVTVTVTSTTGSPSFTMKASPPVETVSRGDLGAFLLELKSVNGFNGTVTLTCSGGPAGTQCKDFPMTVKVKGEAFALSGLLFPKNCARGTYVITFTGVSGAITVKTTATFIVK